MQDKITKPEKTISLSNLPSIIVAVVLIVGIGAVYGLIGYLVLGIKENVTPVIQKPSLEITDNYFGNEFIQVKSPQKNATIKSPVLISGKANVFEANVRIRISDDNKNILADDFITAGGWMDKLYSFTKEIDYKMPQTEKGLIEIFEESAKDGSEIYKVEVPVVFGEYEDFFSDWKVYRNEKYGYELKYPNSMKIATFPNSDYQTDIKTSNETSYTLTATTKVSPRVSNKISNPECYEKINTEMINNIEWSVNDHLCDMGGKISTIYYSTVHNSYVFEISFRGDDLTNKMLKLNQILSTFKFIEKDEIADENKPSIYPSKGGGSLILLNGEKTGFPAYEFEKENIILFQEEIYNEEKSQNHYSLKTISTVSPYEIKTLIDDRHTNCMDNGRLLGEKNDVYFFKTEIDAPGSYYELFLFNPVNMDFVLIENLHHYKGYHLISLYSSASKVSFNFEKRSGISSTGKILLLNDNDIEIIFNEKSFTKKEVDQGKADYIKDIFNYNFKPFELIDTDEINNKESNGSVDAYLKYFPKKIPYFTSGWYNYEGTTEDFWVNPDRYFDFEKNEFISSL